MEGRGLGNRGVVRGSDLPQVGGRNDAVGDKVIHVVGAGAGAEAHVRHLRVRVGNGETSAQEPHSMSVRFMHNIWTCALGREQDFDQ